MALLHLTKTTHHSGYPTIDPSNPTNSAAGKTVVISGGASGIGYAIAQGFSIAGAATVVLLARRKEALEESSTKLRAENAAANRTTEVWTYLLDIRDSTATYSVFEAIRKRLNDSNQERDEPRDADVVVTSAANLAQGQATLDFDLHVYRDTFETNVIGNLNVVRAFLAPEAPAIPFVSMDGKVKDTGGTRARTRAKVILDVSTSSAYTILPGQSLYGASKLAFTRIMRTLQSEIDKLDGAPIRIYSFNPGIVYTPGAKKSVDKKVDLLPWDEESLPSGFAVWLASPAATFLKGRFVMSTWDVEEMIAMRKKFQEDPDFCTITLKL